MWTGLAKSSGRSGGGGSKIWLWHVLNLRKISGGTPLIKPLFCPSLLNIYENSPTSTKKFCIFLPTSFMFCFMVGLIFSISSRYSRILSSNKPGRNRNKWCLKCSLLSPEIGDYRLISKKVSPSLKFGLSSFSVMKTSNICVSVNHSRKSLMLLVDTALTNSSFCSKNTTMASVEGPGGDIIMVNRDLLKYLILSQVADM